MDTVYYFALDESGGGTSEHFKYLADAQEAAVAMLKEGALPITVCKAVGTIDWVDRKAGTYTVTPLR